MPFSHRIDGKRRVRLTDFDPDEDGGVQRQRAEKRLGELEVELSALQELLYAAQQTAVLIVLQGMDTSGKDGTIRHVMRSFNPQGCDVASFKAPTELERSHDYLWRIHPRAPISL